jgi:hypothetical protein
VNEGFSENEAEHSLGKTPSAPRGRNCYALDPGNAILPVKGQLYMSDEISLIVFGHPAVAVWTKSRGICDHAVQLSGI